MIRADTLCRNSEKLCPEMKASDVAVGPGMIRADTLCRNSEKRCSEKKVLHAAVLVECHNFTDRTHWNIGLNYDLTKIS